MYVYADESAATEAFDKLTSAAARTCLGSELARRVRRQAESDIEVGKAQIGRVSGTPLGDERETTRLALPASKQGFNAHAVYDTDFVRVGRGIAVVSTSAIGLDLDRSSSQ